MERVGQYEKAIKYFLKAIELNPDDNWAKDCVCLLYCFMGNDFFTCGGDFLISQWKILMLP